MEVEVYKFYKNKLPKQQSHLKLAFNYLQTHIATASMVCEETGIPQKSFCRYKRYYEKKGMMHSVKVDRCKVTGKTAEYLTTNENWKPFNNQLKLF